MNFTVSTSCAMPRSTRAGPFLNLSAKVQRPQRRFASFRHSAAIRSLPLCNRKLPTLRPQPSTRGTGRLCCAAATNDLSASQDSEANKKTPSGVVLSSPAATSAQLAAVGRRAAKVVNDGDVVGLGSGRAAIAFVRALAERMQQEGITCTGVPTGSATAAVAKEVGIPLASPADVMGTGLDVVVDGADEVDADLNLVKGGGGNLLREKILESQAKKLVIVVGEEKAVDTLGMGAFPVFLEVVEFGRPGVTQALEAQGATVTQRMVDAEGASVIGSAGVGPFLTDDGNPYLHVEGLVREDTDLRSLDAWLHALPGVVETGLFIDMATEAFIARVDGKIEHRTRTRKVDKTGPEPVSRGLMGDMDNTDKMALGALALYTLLH